jgi:hypothetical protein
MDILQRMEKPSPKWFRIANSIYTDLENTVIAVLLVCGYSDQAPVILIFKIVSSFIRNTLDKFMVESEDSDKP